MPRTLLTATIIGCALAASGQTDSSGFFLQKGLEEKTKGRRMESLKYFEKAYAYNKNSREVVSELASAYLDLRRYAQAKEKYVQVEGMGDRSDNTYKQLMLLSFNMRQFDDAIRYAQQLEKVAPAEKTAYYLGKAYFEKEDLGNAIRHLDAATKEDAQNPEIPYTIARAYTDMQNYKQAVPYFQKAIALQPQQSRWLYELSLVYYAMNDDQNSLKYMQLAADQGYRKDNEFMNNLATAYLNAGRFAEGIAVLKDILQRRPSDKGILEALAQAHYNAKKYDEAIGYYDELLRADNKNAEALYMIGMSYQKKGDKQKGMQLCDKAIEMDPSLQNLKQKKEMPNIF